MTTQQKVQKTPAKKAQAAKPGGSIGFLKAAEKAHVAVSDIPLTFMSDLGIMSDQMESAKAVNRKFVGGMYEYLGEVTQAPGKMTDYIVAKVKGAVSDVAGKPVVKKSASAKAPAKAKPKAAVKAKAPAKTPAKAKPKVAAKANAPAKAKPKAAAKAKTPVKTPAKAKPKAVAKPKVPAKVEPHKASDGLHLN
jgi:hypothetical protein